MDARKARTAGQPGETADDFRASPDAPIFVIENFGRGTIRVGQARDRMDGVSSLIRQLALAIKLLLVSRHGGSMLIPGSSQASLICCWLNYLFLQNRRRIVLYNIFPETQRRWKHAIYRQVCSGATLNIVWSERQRHLYAQYLNLPTERFMKLSHKSNLSARPESPVLDGNFVFSGGDRLRDYSTVFKALGGTAIPVIVSTSRSEVLQDSRCPDNFILTTVWEPHFSRLLSSSTFVVIAIVKHTVRGAAEATICDAMWQGKAVIVADDVSASDYVIDGVTGYVVPAGDEAALQARCLELWNDRTKAAEMGLAGQRRARAQFTQRQFVHRLLDLAGSLGASAPSKQAQV